MTVDVEDYFMVTAFSNVVRLEDWAKFPSRVQRNTNRILDIFDEKGVKGTFFVLGWIAERHSGVVKEIQRRGHEVSSHGYDHRLVYEMSPEEFRADVRRAKKSIEDAAGERVIGYRAPSYSITEKSLWALEILAEEGYEYDSSIFPIHHDRYGIPEFSRFPLKVRMDDGSELCEIPLSTLRLLGKNIPIAGGGYFRLYPISFTLFGIGRINERHGLPAVVYIHPWELDPGQPRIPSGPATRFRHYVNLGRVHDRLRTLLADYRFSPMRTFLRDHHSLETISYRDLPSPRIRPARENT